MNSATPNFINRQCAFDMVKNGRDKYFEVVIQGNKYIQQHSQQYYMRNNELLMHAWDETNPAKLPIQAFFYIKGTTDGLQPAQQYQNDYETQTQGIQVPIVGLTLSPTAGGNISITYQESDQNQHGGGGG